LGTAGVPIKLLAYWEGLSVSADYYNLTRCVVDPLHHDSSGSIDGAMQALNPGP
jgi:hypothetical protein